MAYGVKETAVSGKSGVSRDHDHDRWRRIPPRQFRAAHIRPLGRPSFISTRLVTDFQVPWEIGRWIASLLLMVIGLDLVNYFLPNVKRRWHWLTPGTAFVVLTMVIGSASFNFYLRHFGSYPRFYGTMAGFIILMTWIYVASLILLIGAETDSVIEDTRQRKPDDLQSLERQPAPAMRTRDPCCFSSLRVSLRASVSQRARRKPSRKPTRASKVRRSRRWKFP